MSGRAPREKKAEAIAPIAEESSARVQSTKEPGGVEPSAPDGSVQASPARDTPSGRAEFRPSSFEVLVLSGTKALAAKRHVSLRTLHRRLADRGVATRAVRDEERRRLLSDLLREAVPLAEVARRVGLASTDSLARVVRKLFGLPPSKVRERLTSGNE